MWKVALVFVALCTSQDSESAESISRRLSDDSPQVRDSASVRLIKLGEKARPALERMRDTSDPELRKRIEYILTTLDSHRETRVHVKPPIRVSLKGDFGLREAARELSRQAGHTIKATHYPEGTFQLDLENALYWEALEKICAASGLRTPELTKDGILLSGPAYIRKPWTHKGALAIRFDSVERDGNGESGTLKDPAFALCLALGWEQSCVPIMTRILLTEAIDDKGVDLLPGFDSYSKALAVHVPGTLDPPPLAYSNKFYFASIALPKRSGKYIPVLKGKAIVCARASATEMIMDHPCDSDSEGAKPTRTATSQAIHILDEELTSKPDAVFTIVEMGQNSAKMRLEGLDVGLLLSNSGLCVVTDERGRHYAATLYVPVNAMDKFELSFPDIPEDAKVARITFRIPTRMVYIEMPFELKQVPLE